MDNSYFTKILSLVLADSLDTNVTAGEPVNTNNQFNTTTNNSVNNKLEKRIIGGKTFTLPQNVWNSIYFSVKEKMKRYIEDQRYVLSSEEYSKLLDKYFEWENNH